MRTGGGKSSKIKKKVDIVSGLCLIFDWYWLTGIDFMLFDNYDV